MTIPGEAMSVSDTQTQVSIFRAFTNILIVFVNTQPGSQPPPVRKILGVVDYLTNKLKNRY